MGDKLSKIFLQVETDDRVKEFAIKASQFAITLHESVEMITSHSDSLKNKRKQGFYRLKQELRQPVDLSLFFEI